MKELKDSMSESFWRAYRRELADPYHLASMPRRVEAPAGAEGSRLQLEAWVDVHPQETDGSGSWLYHAACLGRAAARAPRARAIQAGLVPPGGDAAAAVCWGDWTPALRFDAPDLSPGAVRLLAIIEGKVGVAAAAGAPA